MYFESIDRKWYYSIKFRDTCQCSSSLKPLEGSEQPFQLSVVFSLLMSLMSYVKRYNSTVLLRDACLAFHTETGEE